MERFCGAGVKVVIMTRHYLRNQINQVLKATQEEIRVHHDDVEIFLRMKLSYETHVPQNVKNEIIDKI
jgi:hypothetical protein